MKRLAQVLLLMGVIAAAATSLHAQSSQVSGQIVDTSHAGVPGAKVTLTRVESGDKREKISGTEGYYSFPLLIPGHYTLNVEKQGFQSQIQSGIVVLTASVTAVNVTLQVGLETQTVNVEASLPLLETETSAVSGVVVRARARNSLPHGPSMEKPRSLSRLRCL